ncbi:serine/threonine protein phosphatase [Clostridia bacterium]|nr:serine/threonine protein phosphatase [Clostridia bacterium]
MKYAVISDIHGNIYALEAVLADAKAQQVDTYLLLGDYTRDYSWPNEVVNTIRALDNAVIIRGNNEDYLAQMSKDQTAWQYENLGLFNWNCREITTNNFEYLTSLPESERVVDHGETIHLSHISDIFFRKPKISIMYASDFRTAMESKPFSHAQYQQMVLEAILSRPDALADVMALPKGVYLYGHNHLQSHIEIEDRLFINPGSSGDQLDFCIDPSYTILEWTPHGWRVEERRVAYDVERMLNDFRASDLYAFAPELCILREKSTLTGKEFVGCFLKHVNETGIIHGETGFPVSNDIWHAAWASWDMDNSKGVSA